jgi:hypothetical protein
MADKILIANVDGLQKKYGPKGQKAVLTALRALIAADKKRDLNTRLIDISSAADMRRCRGKKVSSPGNERQSKDAVDAIYKALEPDYLVLIDGPDVIPHLTLNNPVPKDKDPNVPSDLPYASDASYTSRDAAKYAAVTRVVGRIPGITGAKEPDHLVKLLQVSAAFKSRPRKDYMPFFGISAAVWSKSTVESVDNIFDSKTIKSCPPTGMKNVTRLLSPLSHFINCHGGEVDPQFYGQKGQQFPEAMTSDNVTKGVKRDTMVAAECCFGAQLFDPKWTAGKLPICNAYLAAGSVGFFGSSTTAYGPEEGNSGADLITQYFLIDALKGASTGRSSLQARQKFVSGQKMEDPVNLKTLAQFLLLGDPSLQPCLSAAPHHVTKAIDPSAARKTRRVALTAAGKAAFDSSGFPGKRIVRPPKALHDVVRKVAREKGMRAGRDDLESFHIVGGEDYGVEMKRRKVQQSVFVVTNSKRPSGKRPKHIPDIHVLVAHAQDNRLIRVEAYVRR